MIDHARYRTRRGTRLFAVLLAVLPAAGASGGTGATAAIAGGEGSALSMARARDAGQAPVIAWVNGVTISRATLDAAVVESGRADTSALRRDLKQRLIAREVLRQAAARAGHPAPCLERTAAGVAAASDPSLVRCAEHEIGRYLRSAMHPSAVTDADIRSRYADLSRPRAVAGGAPGDKTPMLPATAQLLRERIQNERFDDELRRLVQRLTDEADIRQ